MLLVSVGLAANPDAVDDTYPLVVNGPTTIPAATGVLLNDSVPCGDAVTIRVVIDPVNGTINSWSARKARLVGATKGGFTYTPDNLAAPSDDSFVYEINCNGLVS